MLALAFLSLVLAAPRYRLYLCRRLSLRLLLSVFRWHRYPVWAIRPSRLWAASRRFQC